MNDASSERVSLDDTLAEGVAAIMAADNDAAAPDTPRPEDMADLFLSELNRLWADPAPLVLA